MGKRIELSIAYLIALPIALALKAYLKVLEWHDAR